MEDERSKRKLPQRSESDDYTSPAIASFKKRKASQNFSSSPYEAKREEEEEETDQHDGAGGGGGEHDVGEYGKVYDANRRNLKARHTMTEDDKEEEVRKGPAWKGRMQLYYPQVKLLNEFTYQFGLKQETKMLRALFNVEKESSGSSEEDAVAVSLKLPTEAQMFQMELQSCFLARFYKRHMSRLKDLYRRPSNGEVLLFGSGECSQLGVGPDILESKRPRKVTNLQNSRVMQIACGGLHNAAVTNDGTVYSWGCSDDGSLGRDSQNSEFVPLPVHFEEGGANAGGETQSKSCLINRVAAGDCQTLCVALDGSLYGFGCYKDSEGKQWKDLPASVGNHLSGKETDDELRSVLRGKHQRPVKISGVKHVEEVACGFSFNAVRLLNGDVLTWGIDQCGELARGTKHEQRNKQTGEYDYKCILHHNLTPLPPQWYDGHKRRVETLACGGYHLLLTTAAGGMDGLGCRLFAVGLNNYGQLGLGDTKSRSVLTKVDVLEELNVCLIAAGTHHSLATDADGNLVAFGRGDSGQLGVTKERPSAGYFEKTPVPVFLCEEDEENYGKMDGVARGPKDAVKQIACGSNHNFAVTEGGVVYSWGFGDLYALGHGVGKDEYRPRKLDVTSGLANKEGISEATVYQVSGGGQHSGILCALNYKAK